MCSILAWIEGDTPLCTLIKLMLPIQATLRTISLKIKGMDIGANAVGIPISIMKAHAFAGSQRG
jgi:hypothetical protein